jgi:hypothetical protein
MVFAFWIKGLLSTVSFIDSEVCTDINAMSLLDPSDSRIVIGLNLSSTGIALRSIFGVMSESGKGIRTIGECVILCSSS